MDQDQSEMESRLDDVLSRIAMETQEIKELEQQLTDGQILANEALKRDLEVVVSGLQLYLKSLRAQTSQAQVKAQSLQAENQSLRRHLMVSPRHSRRLEEQATAHTQSMSVESGAMLDSGLDLHLLSSPERAPPTGAAGNCLYSPVKKDRRHHHHHHRHRTDTDQSEDSVTLRCSTEAAGPAGGAHTQEQLRSETERLQRTLRRHRRVLGVCEEVWCVEQTLTKRRAELREAQRRLQEARSSTTQARCEAAEWEQRAKDSATCLQRTHLQLRELQDEVEALGKSRRVHTQDKRGLSQSLDRVGSQLDSLRSQEEQLQRRIQELRGQETRVRSTLQSLVQQQEALLSQRSSVVSVAAEEEQRVERLRTELDSTRTELKQTLEELLSEREELVQLKTLRSRDLSTLQETQDQLDQARTELDQTKDQVDQTQNQLGQARAELSQAKEQLGKTVENVRRKEEELTEKQKELDQSQAAADRKRAELIALEQEVETSRMEAESCLKETERQRRELQEVKEKLERRTEQSSGLQQQCRHLEDRRRHAHRCLSAVEAELERLKQEQSQSVLTQQEVKKETAANQDKLNESSELLCFLGEKLEERKVQLQTLEQELSALGETHKQKLTELSALGETHKQKLTELQELEKHRQHSEASAAETEREDRGRCVSLEQLSDEGEELREREKQLLQREAELRRKEEELRHKEELRRGGAEFKEEVEELLQEEVRSELEDSDGASSEEFYLWTAGLRSASSPEDERWRVELETDKLRLQEDSLKARLRCSLQTHGAHSFQELETEQSVRSLRDSVERLDCLLRTTAQE